MGRRVASSALLAVAILATTACAGRNRPGPPASGRSGDRTATVFTATAYCQGTRTATGTRPNERTVAADPTVLPMGSRIRISGLEKRYNREYVVGDTGSAIRGRRIDLYMRDCRAAVAFGRRSVRVSVLR